MKLFDSEWKVMEVLWQENDRTAKEISLRLADSIGWNKNTTYTVIKKCIDKGAIERWEPNFICHAVITKQQAQKEEADTLVEKVFGGSAELLFASILSDRSLSKDIRTKIASVFPKAPVFPENSKTRIPSHPDSRKCTPVASESDPDSKKTFHFGDNTDRYHCTTDMPSYNLVCFFSNNPESEILPRTK